MGKRCKITDAFGRQLRLKMAQPLQKLEYSLMIGRIGHAAAQGFGIAVKPVSAKNPVQRQRQPGKIAREIAQAIAPCGVLTHATA